MPSGENSLSSGGEKANIPNEARDKKVAQGALNKIAADNERAQKAASEADKFAEMRRKLAEKQGLNPTAGVAPQPQPEKSVAPQPQPEKPQQKPESKGEKDQAKKEKAVEKQKNNKAFKKGLLAGGLIGAATIATATAIIAGVLVNKHNTVSNEEKPGITQNYTPPTSPETKKDQVESILEHGTGYPEFDKTVTGNFDQYHDLGMFDTEVVSDANPDGKHSPYSNFAPRACAREYLGKDYDDCTDEEKGKVQMMAAFKQDFCAAGYLQIWDPEFADMSYVEITNALRDARERGDTEYLMSKVKLLDERFNDPDMTIYVTTVGDLDEKFANMEGAGEAIKTIREEDGIITEEGVEISLTNTHSYADKEYNPIEKAVPTPAGAEVVVFKYGRETVSTHATEKYVMAWCGNHFKVITHIDMVTKKTRITVIVTKKDKIQEKDVQNAIKSFGDQAKKESEERGFDTIVEYYDADGPDGDGTLTPMEFQQDLPKAEQSPTSKEAIDTNTDKSTGYDENVNKPTTPDDPDGAAKGEQNKVEEEDTMHDEDLGDKSVDQLLKQ